MAESGCDDDRIWRAAFREGYRRNPKAGELDRYKFWHGISRRDGFDASGPWECWPSRPIPPDAESPNAPPKPVVNIVHNVEWASVPPETSGKVSTVSSEETVAIVPAANGTDSTHDDRPPAKSGFSGDLVSSPKRRGRPSRVQRAQALLQAQFADGPKPGALVEAAAAAAAIPERSLIAAADALGVRCRQGQWWLPVTVQRQDRGRTVKAQAFDPPG